uniref:Uncharacterized protein n=1 Tax=Amphora coffeiformis TaxID=265554 RepID=A0A6S8J9W2_9STRA|mmetsp:Transcript_3503/g.6978  ORF Transcript_3503/g.6978 Transcript_3503/m.6978 type:complete len:349 (-) Transcript_3503:483-1529(-)
MPQVNFSCSCGSWLIRTLTWGAIVAAFGLSLASLTACDLVKGRVLYYKLRDRDAGIYGNPCNPNPCNVSLGETCTVIVWNGENNYQCEAPLDEYYEEIFEKEDPAYYPTREAPDIIQEETFTLGVYKAKDNSVNYGYGECIDYSNDLTDLWLEDGPAEGSARFFGTLATTLGGLCMVGFLGLAASGTKEKLYVFSLGGILVLAAFFQMFIFTLFSSEHCHNDFWADYRSKEEMIERTDVSATCELGDGGWYALVALILYLFGALLATTKWSDPAYKVCLMEWNKDFSRDPGHFQNSRTLATHDNSDEEQQDMAQEQAPMKIHRSDSTEEEEDEYIDGNRTPFKGAPMM